MQGLVFVDK